MNKLNNTLKALIVDDESGARNTLAKLIEVYCPEVEIAGTADSVKNAVNLVYETQPDLMFLDIEELEASGFELIEKTNSIEAGLIFTTAHNKYTLKAIKTFALDYLLKPIDITDLKAAIKKYQDTKFKMDVSRYQLLREQITNENHQKTEISRLAIASSDGYDILDVDQIQYCEGNRNYTTLYLSCGNTFVASKTLKEYEKLLPASDFIRVHQKFLINLKYVRKINKGRGGSLIMTDGKIIAVSQNKKN